MPWQQAAAPPEAASSSLTGNLANTSLSEWCSLHTERMFAPVYFLVLPRLFLLPCLFFSLRRISNKPKSTIMLVQRRHASRSSGTTCGLYHLPMSLIIPSTEGGKKTHKDMLVNKSFPWDFLALSLTGVINTGTGFLSPAPSLAVAVATQALFPLMPGKNLLQTLTGRENRSWPVLAEGKLLRLLKWLASYQAQQKTAVSSTVVCLAAITTAGSAGHSRPLLSSWHCTVLPCCSYGD